MAGYEDVDYQTEGMPVPTQTGSAQPVQENDDRPVSDAERAQVTEWVGRVQAAKKFHEKAFRRMREDMYFATWGAPKEWLAGNNYVVPIVSRHINEVTASLYAKDPQVVVEPRKTLDYKLWDGTQDALMSAGQSAMMGDPNAMALMQEVLTVREQQRQLANMGKTMVCLWNYFMGEQDSSYKAQFKALVRRAKVCSVGYVKLGYQRALQERPDVTAQINDATSQLKAMQRLIEEMGEGEIDESSADMYQLKTLIDQLSQQQYLIVREGPVFAFPKSTKIIIDPDCKHLKTLAGANWIAEEYDLLPEKVEEMWGIDLGGQYTSYRLAEDTGPAATANIQIAERNKSFVRVWRVESKALGQEFVIADGYPGFLRQPGPPDVDIERFWTIFPLVFNEVESEDELYPPSDVRAMRDTQQEYNRARQTMRDHRYAGRPAYVTSKGALEEEDLKKFESHPTNAIIEVQALEPGQDVKTLLMAKPVMPIDPNFYETAMFFDDIQRVVGTSAANLGGTSNATATETSVAEQSRTTWLASNVDDLDDLMTDLAKSTGQLMLMQLDKQTAIEIAGPGAVWPDMPMTRDQAAKDLLLTIKAGSSGRPNRAAELANLERAMPFIMQLPGMNPYPFAKKYCDLLDIDLEEAAVDGLPSIQSINAMLSKPPTPPQQGAQTKPNSPDQQGPEGQNNAPSTETEPGPQPAYPTAA